MSDTFAVVNGEKEQSALFEQVNLIDDFFWLLDLKKIFKEKKYIVRVVPDLVTKGQNVDFLGELDSRQGANNIKNENYHNEMMKRMDQMESNMKRMDQMDSTRGMIKDLADKVVKIQKAQN